jgi:hypothetical protein
MLDCEFCGNVHFKGCPKLGGWSPLWLSHGSVCCGSLRGVTGITYVTLDHEFCGNVHFKSCPKLGGWSPLWLSHGSVCCGSQRGVTGITCYIRS